MIVDIIDRIHAKYMHALTRVGSLRDQLSSDAIEMAMLLALEELAHEIDSAESIIPAGGENESDWKTRYLAAENRCKKFEEQFKKLDVWASKYAGSLYGSVDTATLIIDILNNYRAEHNIFLLDSQRA